MMSEEAIVGGAPDMSIEVMARVRKLSQDGEDEYAIVGYNRADSGGSSAGRPSPLSHHNAHLLVTPKTVAAFADTLENVTADQLEEACSPPGPPRPATLRRVTSGGWADIEAGLSADAAGRSR